MGSAVRTGPTDGEDGPRSQTIADDLRRRILSGSATPGTRIRQEELAAQHGTSRIPVREALRNLEAEGLVVLVPNSGAWVAGLDTEACVETYKIREKLEPLALGESIVSMTPETMDRLFHLVHEIERATDIEEFLRLDREFHLSSYEVAGMPTLLSMIDRLWNRTQQYRRIYASIVAGEDRWIINYEHSLIMEAVRRRDVVDAGHLLESHIRRTRMGLLARSTSVRSALVASSDPSIRYRRRPIM